MLVMLVLFILATEPGHSDPTKLKETAENVQQLSSENLKQRQLEIKVSILLNGDLFFFHNIRLWELNGMASYRGSQLVFIRVVLWLLPTGMIF